MQNTIRVQDFCHSGLSVSDAIEQCVNEAAGRDILFDGGDYYIDRAILLKSGVSFVIDGCSIIQNDGVYDNVFRGDNLMLDPRNPYGAALAVSKLRDIKIIGKNGAKIIGCTVNRCGFHPVMQTKQEMIGDFWGWRTLQVCVSNCNGFEISGVEFHKSRCWAMSFDYCQNVNVHDIGIFSNVKNGDGIDFRAGCNNCRVKNIYGFTSDDTVACTALDWSGVTYPYKNYLYPLEPASNYFQNFPAEFRDIHDISISGISTGGHCHVVICLSCGGLKVYNINITGIHEPSEGSREAAVKIYTGYGGGYRDGDISDISVSDVDAHISRYAVMCNVLPCRFRFSGISAEPPCELYNLYSTDGIVFN